MSVRAGRRVYYVRGGERERETDRQAERQGFFLSSIMAVAVVIACWAAAMK